MCCSGIWPDLSVSCGICEGRGVVSLRNPVFRIMVKNGPLLRARLSLTILAVTIYLGLVCTACFASQPVPVLREQYPEWAVPILLEGVPNLHKVGDALYRGAQPTTEGIHALAALGIKTIVNFRFLHSDRDDIGDLDVYYEHIPILISSVTDNDVRRFLQIVTDPERVPVFIHCQHGADRTGVMSAVYRIVVQDWSKDAAILEMTEGGYGYHSLFRNLVGFLETLDVEKIRTDLGIRAVAE